MHRIRKSTTDSLPRWQCASDSSRQLRSNIWPMHLVECTTMHMGIHRVNIQCRNIGCQWHCMSTHGVREHLLWRSRALRFSVGGRSPGWWRPYSSARFCPHRRDHAALGCHRRSTTTAARRTMPVRLLRQANWAQLPGTPLGTAGHRGACHANGMLYARRLELIGMPRYRCEARSLAVGQALAGLDGRTVHGAGRQACERGACVSAHHCRR